jgi:hypothetical protein
MEDEICEVCGKYFPIGFLNMKKCDDCLLQFAYDEVETRKNQKVKIDGM